MRVWVVSLLTDQLSPNSLTIPLALCVFWVWLVTTSCDAMNHSVLYPTKCITERYTKIYFGENQLSPGSFGILPLTSGHLNPLLRIRVRASSRLSTGFTLPKVSSPGFGSNEYYKVSQLGIAFTTPPQVSLFKQKQYSITHRFILQ